MISKDGSAGSPDRLFAVGSNDIKLNSLLNASAPVESQGKGNGGGSPGLAAGINGTATYALLSLLTVAKALRSLYSVSSLKTLVGAMKLNFLPKWRAIFRSDGKPHLEKSKAHNAISSSTNPSGPKDESQRPQALTTQAELVPAEPAASSATEPTASTAQSGSLTLHNSVAPREEDEAVTAQSLWDRAYDGLRHKDEQLVVKYEELLSQELPPKMGTQSTDKWSDRIDNTNLEYRQEQLKTIANNGLQRMEEGKTNYIIFGHEFVPRDQIAQAARFVQGIKVLVAEAVRVSPEASLAWAGVCTILPILTNAVAAEEANRNGFTYVTSRMRFYAELEHFLWPASPGLATGLRREFENHLVDIYQHILEFQVRTVLRFYQTRLARLGDDVVKHDVWEEILSKIQELERVFDSDLKKISDASSRTELESLNKKADKFLADMGRILSALETHNKPANSSFNYHGSGYQFNATGGIQNNNSGSGYQITGATFDARVQFGGKVS